MQLFQLALKLKSFLFFTTAIVSTGLLLGKKSATAQAPVHQWSFEESLGVATEVADSSGSGNTGFGYGNIIADGRFGNAVRLRNATDSDDPMPLDPALGDGFGNLAASNLPLQAGDSWTINLWARFPSDVGQPGNFEYFGGFGATTANDVGAISGGSRALLSGTEITAPGPRLRFWGFDIDLAAPSVVPGLDDQWHMYSATYNGTNLFLYFDGQLRAFAAPTFDVAAPQVQVGNPSFTNTDFDGDIDEFSIYNTALDTAQIGELFSTNAVGGGIDLSATVDLSTGEISIINGAGNPATSIIGYTIRSESGALSPMSGDWAPIAGRLDAVSNGGDGSFDSTGSWSTATNTSLDFSTQLSETTSGNGGSLAASGATGSTVSLGQAWIASPFEDVIVDIVIDDGTAQNLTVTVNADFINGSTILAGDFNGDGDITSSEWQMFRDASASTLSAGLLPVENYLQGDLNIDGVKDINDYAIFQASFDALNGAGALQSLINSQVPEPNAVALMAFAILGATLCIRKQRGFVLASLIAVICVGLGSACNAQTHAYWKFNNTGDNENTNSDLTLTGGANYGQSVHPGLGNSLGTFTQGDGAIGQNFTRVTGNNLTAVAWAFSTSNAGPWNTIVKQWGQSVVGQFHLGLGLEFAETMDAEIGNPSVHFTDDTNFELNQWIHTAFVFDDAADEYRLYFDGVLAHSAPYTANLVQPTDTGLATGIGVGIKPNDDGTATDFGTWFGQLDDVAIFDRVLSETEIGQIHDNGLAGIQVDGTSVAFLTLEVDRVTGDARIIGDSDQLTAITAYQIQSSEGALLSSNLASIASGSDFTAGNGTGNGWEADGANGSNQIIETSGLSGSSDVGIGEEILLGNIVQLGEPENLAFTYLTAEGTFSTPVNYVGTLVGLPGDFNNDDVVDVEDYTVWRDNLGGNSSVLNGNGSGAATVVAADYAVWEFNFGRTVAPPAGVVQAQVPEPSTVVLAAMVLCVWAGIPAEVYVRKAR